MKQTVSNKHVARPFGLSAFVRCKNEEEFIVASLLSVYRFFDELVVILNKSTDRTRELVEDLVPDHPKIRLLTYEFECAPAGVGYLDRVQADPTRSLARYYNWCLEQTRFTHVCKWDGDMIGLPPFQGVLDLIRSHDVVAIDGYDVMGQPTVSLESRVFRYDVSHTLYDDWDLYEVLKHDYTSVVSLPEKCYAHMKLVKREWIHRTWESPNDFATQAYPSPSSSAEIAPGRVARLVSRALRRLRS